MMRSLAPDRERATLAVVAAALVLAMPSTFGQVGAIVLGGLAGITVLRGGAPTDHVALPHAVSRTAAIAAIVLFFALLLGLPLVIAAVPSHGLQLFDAFYRAGSLVFGGGHVVLPLLQAAVVPPGWVDNDAFLAGYGAAQAVPGPLFTFAAYLGAVMGPPPNGWVGRRAVPRRDVPAVVPAGHRRRCRSGTTCGGSRGRRRRCAASMPPWSACCSPRSTIRCGRRASPAPPISRWRVAAFLLLFMWKTPPWLVVVLSAAGGALISAF